LTDICRHFGWEVWEENMAETSTLSPEEYDQADTMMRTVQALLVKLMPPTPIVKDFKWIGYSVVAGDKKEEVKK